jgi:ABC-type polysaccharide/polyol phosphate transport system ATPase subunit
MPQARWPAPCWALPGSKKHAKGLPMSFEFAIEVKNLGKCFQIYEKPADRLKQMLLRGRGRYYREFWALKDISFKVKKGETVGIIGLNGAGKSTLLQIISGTMTPTEGSYKTNGRISALLELGAGFNPEFSGIENIKISGRLYGLSEKEIEGKINSIIEFSGIGDHVKDEVKTYSSGMFVRLAFSVVAHLEPKVLIVDEALSVGDFIFQQKCARFMKENLAETTKLLVSHDLSAISNLADRVIVLNQGRLEFIGDTQQGLALYQKIARATEVIRNDVQLESMQIQNTSDTEKVDEEWFEITESSQSGTGRIEIQKIRWSASGQRLLKTIKKNDELLLEFCILAKSIIEAPIIGYQIQDRFGNAVFGENTLSSSFEVEPMGIGIHKATIKFRWPQIAPGEYGVTVGVGNGYGSTAHTVEGWAHNVIVLVSQQTDPIHGIFNNKIQSFNIKEII